ncbi:hypothetical protein AURDEDRAFT_164375 [Auricularia subglabra TFB-10046 SS5]|nr:hypothetical protein AURDEDRAFT_164375 [Auricularia subglabra TFB-10046 SS5]
MILILLVFVSSSLARLVNVTIDDTFGDARTGVRPDYMPADLWIETCSSCAGTIKDSPFDWSQVHNSTLHEPLQHAEANMTLAFTGQKIYLYFVQNPTVDTVLTFYLDGASRPAGTYSHRSTKPSSIDASLVLFNQMLFESPTLPEANHSLIVATSARDFPVVFDYAIYTTMGVSMEETPSSTPELGATSASHVSSSAQNTGASTGSDGRTTARPAVQTIQDSTTSTTMQARNPAKSSSSIAQPVRPILGPVIGGAVGGLAALILGACLFRILQRRRRQRVDIIAPLSVQESTRAADNSDVKRKTITYTREKVVPYYPPPGLPDIALKSAKLRDDARQADTASPSRNTAMLRLEAELARMRVENEILRQVAEPPPY